MDLPHFEYYHKCSNTLFEMDWKVITINVFYVQLLKVGSCTNDDKSVPKILLSFSASINDFIFRICYLWENLKILMKIASFLVYAQTMYWNSST